jgi:hypothetical protein
VIRDRGDGVAGHVGVHDASDRWFRVVGMSGTGRSSRWPESVLPCRSRWSEVVPVAVERGGDGVFGGTLAHEHQGRDAGHLVAAYSAGDAAPQVLAYDRRRRLSPADHGHRVAGVPPVV